MADGLLYAIGGVSVNGVLRSVEHYDPAVNAWSSAPDLPIGLRDAAAVGNGRDVIVIGGFTDAAGRTPSARVFALRDRTWRELAPLRTARGALGAAVVKGKVYAIGGREAGDRPSRRVEILSGTKWSTGAALPTGRSNLAVTAGERHIYAIGGRAREVVGAVERYDTVSGGWTKRAPLGTPRSDLRAIGGDATVLALGGTSASDVAVTTVETYATGTNSWSVFEPPLPAAVRAFVAGLVDTRLVIATGATGAADSFTAQTLSLPVTLSAVAT